MLPSRKETETFAHLLRNPKQLNMYLHLNRYNVDKCLRDPKNGGLVCRDSFLLSKLNMSPLERLYLYKLEGFILVACYRFILNLKKELCYLENEDSKRVLVICKDVGRPSMKLKEQANRRVQKLIRCASATKKRINEIQHLLNGTGGPEAVSVASLYGKEGSGELSSATLALFGDLGEEVEHNKLVENLLVILNSIPRQLFDYYLFNVFAKYMQLHLDINSVFVMKSDGNYEGEIVVAKICTKLLVPSLDQRATSQEPDVIHFVMMKYGVSLYDAIQNRALSYTVGELLSKLKRDGSELNLPTCFQLLSTDMDILNFAINVQFAKEAVAFLKDKEEGKEAEGGHNLPVCFQRIISYPKSLFINNFYNLNGTAVSSLFHCPHDHQMC